MVLTRHPRRHSGWIAAVSLLAACGWERPNYITFMPAHDSNDGTSLTAIAMYYHVIQTPTGLRAFPDGGSPRELEAGALVYLCDDGARTLRPLSFVAQRGFDPNRARRESSRGTGPDSSSRSRGGPGRSMH